MIQFTATPSVAFLTLMQGVTGRLWIIINRFRSFADGCAHRDQMQPNSITMNPYRILYI